MSRRSTLSTKPVASLAWSRGFQAGRAKIGRRTNPYSYGDPRRWAWDEGWKYGSKR